MVGLAGSSLTLLGCFHFFSHVIDCEPFAGSESVSRVTSRDLSSGYQYVGGGPAGEQRCGRLSNGGVPKTVNPSSVSGVSFWFVRRSNVGSSACGLFRIVDGLPKALSPGISHREPDKPQQQTDDNHEGNQENHRWFRSGWTTWAGPTRRLSTIENMSSTA